jgi:hypothetical protein
MSTTITIDKHIPIPIRNSAHNYPFAEMEVGDSFQISPKSKKSGLAQAARTFTKKQSEDKRFKFTVRASKTEDTVRIWRVA